MRFIKKFPKQQLLKQVKIRLKYLKSFPIEIELLYHGLLGSNNKI